MTYLQIEILRKDISNNDIKLHYLFLGTCSDSALENVTNRQVMTEGGWRVDGAPEHANVYAIYSDVPNTFWGYNIRQNLKDEQW